VDIFDPQSTGILLSLGIIIIIIVIIIIITIRTNASRNQMGENAIINEAHGR
jgi:hypothetical protein